MFDVPFWAPDGQRVGYGKVYEVPLEYVIESRDLNGEKPVKVLSDSRLAGSSCWLPDGRIIYVRWESPGNTGANLWGIRTTIETGEPAGKPRRITDWVGSTDSHLLTTSADGKRLALKKGNAQSDVYVAELLADGTRLKTPRRLTLDESNDEPKAWTADNKAVIFQSDRNGQWDIYKQGIDQAMAETVFASPENKSAWGLSPDGAWVFFTAQAGASAPRKLMRAPMASGAAQLVSNTEPDRRAAREWRTSEIRAQSCARLPSTFCAYGWIEPGQLILSSYDLVAGKRRELARVPDGTEFDVFPDGSGIAVALGDPAARRIRIISSTGETKAEFPVKGWSAIEHPNCAADSNGLYVTSVSQPGAATLLYVDLQGNARVLWQQKGSPDAWAIPSPDGRYLAIMGMTQTSDAWILENF